MLRLDNRALDGLGLDADRQSGNLGAGRGSLRVERSLRGAGDDAGIGRRRDRREGKSAGQERRAAVTSWTGQAARQSGPAACPAFPQQPVDGVTEAIPPWSPAGVRSSVSSVPGR